MTRLCIKHCGRELGPKNKSGVCRPCAGARLNSDPIARERRQAGLRAYFNQPGAREANAARLARWMDNMPPEHRAARSEHGKRQVAKYLSDPAIAAKANSPEAKARAGQGRTNTVLAWCPPEYRDRYRDLVERKLARAAEAKRMILDEIAAVERKRLAALTPFERQMERVRAGATLITKQPLRRPDPAYTLGGIATGAL